MGIDREAIAKELRLVGLMMNRLNGGLYSLRYPATSWVGGC